MRGRAFTILEIMVVVLLASAISAILIPTLVGRVTGTKLDGATSALRFGAAIAGAEAKRNGEMTVFVAEQDGNEWVLYAEPIEPGQIESVLGRHSLHPPPEEMPEEDLPRRKRVEVGSFDGVEIRDTRLVAMLPEEEADGVSAEELFGDVPESERDADFGPVGPDAVGSPRRWVFGVFFADGSARPARTLYLIADEGRRQRSVWMRPLTGTMQIEPLDSFAEAPIEEGGDEAVVPPIPEPGGEASGGGP